MLSLAPYVLHMFSIGGENRWAAPQGRWDLDVRGVGGKRGGQEAAAAALTNYAYPPFALPVYAEICPHGVRQRVLMCRKTVSCLVWCMLWSGATIVAPSAYAPGLYIDACKGYCLLLAQHCVRQTKRTCIKGLDSGSLFMWKWILHPKGTKTAFSRGVSQLGCGGRRGQAGPGTFSPTPTPADMIYMWIRTGVRETPRPPPEPRLLIYREWHEVVTGLQKLFLVCRWRCDLRPGFRSG